MRMNFPITRIETPAGLIKKAMSLSQGHGLFYNLMFDYFFFPDLAGFLML
jgi:hypothetical protein